MEVDEVVVGGGGGDYSGDQRWSEVVKVVGLPKRTPTNHEPNTKANQLQVAFAVSAGIPSFHNFKYILEPEDHFHLHDPLIKVLAFKDW
ncbi:hypothetical protein MTR_8g028770 [Medicago truncatula]|uniref:Uncharacterized protein n=1 Tax=Medicago truncatula TaxID=3880 RepID=A0A072TMV2_MEDTR|nr:hypothetical protein MTR_8g028770 [Medicago truncatula]